MFVTAIKSALCLFLVLSSYYVFKYLFLLNDVLLPCVELDFFNIFRPLP